MSDPARCSCGHVRAEHERQPSESRHDEGGQEYCTVPGCKCAGYDPPKEHLAQPEAEEDDERETPVEPGVVVRGGLAGRRRRSSHGAG